MANPECKSCVIGWHAECRDYMIDSAVPDKPDIYCCCYDANPAPTLLTGTAIDTANIPKYKSNEDVKDPTSAGRKRAANLFPIEAGMTCEWAGLANAGGGVIPIIGCRGNALYPQKDRQGLSTGQEPGAAHHGPDKSTLNNEPSNVSRICVTCHNRWHALNDPFYSKTRPEQGEPFIPLSGTYIPLVRNGLDDVEKVLATEAEFTWSEEYWSLPDKVRALTPYRKADSNVRE